MKRNPFICVLIAGLLIVSLTGQAAAAFQMACEGTASCCCRNMAAMPAMAAAATPMGEGCCNTPVPQPCDLAGPVSSPAAPFLPSENISEPDIPMALALSTLTAAYAPGDGTSGRISLRPPSLAGPPLYLLTQTFLC